jgi:hypothetical protein
MAQPATARDAERQPGESAEPGMGPDRRENGQAGETGAGGCTQPQMRRFIKSRPYVPMHELRRRFELNGAMDEVQPITTAEAGTIWIGLPARESGFIGELLRQGEIGVEFSHDPHVSIVVGVYAMRPVTR